MLVLTLINYAAVAVLRQGAMRNIAFLSVIRQVFLMEDLLGMLDEG